MQKQCDKRGGIEQIPSHKCYAMLPIGLQVNSQMPSVADSVPVVANVPASLAISVKAIAMSWK
jgi:hypothetical protein